MPSLRQNLATLPRPAWILFGGTFINRFGTFVMPFLAIYMKREDRKHREIVDAIERHGPPPDFRR